MKPYMSAEMKLFDDLCEWHKLQKAKEGSGAAEFPALVWAFAVSAFPNAKSPMTSKERVARAIYDAVLAEREACARIADPLPIEQDDSDYEKQAHDIRDVIASSIRNR